MTEAIDQWLETLAGGVPRVRLNARSTAELVTNTHCSARRALDAARIDKAALAKQLNADTNVRGQSPFAISRGNQFERRVKRDEYLDLLGLLRQQGLDIRTVDILDLRTELPFNPRNADAVLAERATRTREAIVEIATGKAPPGRVLDGAALVWSIGGVDVRLETDALAWWVGEKLRIVEMKSYPVEWGQIGADKVAALAWQTSVYVAALQDLLADEGLDPNLVSTWIYLVCPTNTGLKPSIIEHNVDPQLRLLRRYSAQGAAIQELADQLPGVTVDVSPLAPSQRATVLADALEQLGPNFQPSCLTSCDLAAHCRGRAQADGSPSVLGNQAVQVLAGVRSLTRAADLLTGSRPRGDESEFAALADQVRDAERWVRGDET